MLVSELIEKLLKMPQNMEVCFDKIEFTSQYLDDWIYTASEITTVEEFRVTKKDNEHFTVDQKGQESKLIVLIGDRE